MRFIDEAKIKVIAGHGGPGCVSFRRETFIPRGGPDGGDGGAGGDVIFMASRQLGTLQDFRFKRSYQAANGMHGSGANKAGRDGQDIIIRVPVGTLIKDAQTGEVLVDFKADAQEWLACEGGRGGKGNAHFVTSTHQAPKFAQPGEEGQSLELILELKLLADVGIIGYPNAGKSTLISRISAAKPKIADYPFTTLTPNLGVVLQGDFSFVVADIPGLVEGAHRGVGLGHKFLKHMERTQVFIHLLDGSKLLEEATRPDLDSGSAHLDQAIDSFIQSYQSIRNELGLFKEALLHKPEIIVLNKLDLLEFDPKLVSQACQALRQKINSVRGSHPLPGEPFVISAVTGAGLPELISVVCNELRAKKELLTDGKEPGEALPDDPSLRK
ncbi:MAG: GTPase ObgE [Bdellovibrionia bacterium]